VSGREETVWEIIGAAGVFLGVMLGFVLAVMVM
jgi:hypothetical protein